MSSWQPCCMHQTFQISAGIWARRFFCQRTLKASAWACVSWYRLSAKCDKDTVTLSAAAIALMPHALFHLSSAATLSQRARHCITASPHLAKANKNLSAELLPLSPPCYQHIIGVAVLLILSVELTSPNIRNLSYCDKATSVKRGLLKGIHLRCGSFAIMYAIYGKLCFDLPYVCISWILILGYSAGTELTFWLEL